MKQVQEKSFVGLQSGLVFGLDQLDMFAIWGNFIWPLTLTLTFPFKYICNCCSKLWSLPLQNIKLGKQKSNLQLLNKCSMIIHLCNAFSVFLNTKNASRHILKNIRHNLWESDNPEKCLSNQSWPDKTNTLLSHLKRWQISHPLIAFGATCVSDDIFYCLWNLPWPLPSTKILHTCSKKRQIHAQ